MSILRVRYIAFVAVFSCTPLWADLVPATTPHAPSTTASGASQLSRINADGRYLFFVSIARDLVTNDGLGGFLNIYRYDRLTGENQLVSVTAMGNGGGNGNSSSPAASTNCLVAFVSAATDLISGDTNRSEDVFLRDLNDSTTRLISAAPGGRVPSNPAPLRNEPLSGNPRISQD